MKEKFLNKINEFYPQDEGYNAELANELFLLYLVSNPVVCGNCDGWGYTLDENGRRKENCKQCE